MTNAPKVTVIGGTAYFNYRGHSFSVPELDFVALFHYLETLTDDEVAARADEEGEAEASPLAGPQQP
jgi:hypothetical protein